MYLCPTYCTSQNHAQFHNISILVKGLGIQRAFLNLLKRPSEEDDRYHVKGSSLVAPDRALQYSLDQLKSSKTARCFLSLILSLTSPN